MAMKVSFDDAIKSLQDLIKINSVQAPASEGAPFGKGNVEALAYSLKLLEEFGFKTKNGNNYYGYGDVGNDELPLFGILAHLDVVPISPTWQHDPFGGEIEDGYLYGRGTLDDKGPFIAALYACAQLLNEGYVPKKRIRFILGCNEESGWKCMDKYAKCEEMPLEGFSPDADFPVINCEKGVVYHNVSVLKPDFIKYIKSGERANVVPDKAVAIVKNIDGLKERAISLGAKVEENYGDISITTSGISAHGSTPYKGENALTKLFKILSPYDSVVNTIFKAFEFDNGKGMSLNLSDERSGSLTLNFGVCALNNDKMEVTVDIRYPLNITMDEITNIFKKHFASVGGVVERGAYHLPLYVAKDDPLIQALLGAYNDVTGTIGEAITIGGGTYARVLPKGVAFGPVFPGGESRVHGDDERILLKDFAKTIEIYKEAIKRLCF
ncbi:MAG: Sapep family Mn(2+)-dependent dipeptidase [Clostridia bacterium]|nr:Sapep family Mn(2+)-dependent dipeptidase [Clostridia bacterium]